jgi:D-alanine-D-alanine ligase
VRPDVAIIYNLPAPGRYQDMGEQKAVLGVLDEVESVGGALAESGYAAVRVPLSPPLEGVRHRLESLDAGLVFNLFEGFDGRPETEPAVAGMLSELGMAFTGCPGEALALALDKARAKKVLEDFGIDTPRFQLIGPGTLPEFSLRFPCIVKPRAEDASHGLTEDSVVDDFASLRRQVEMVSRLFGGMALVEEFAGGREFNVTVVGNDAPEVLPVSEIAYRLPSDRRRLLTYAAKWEPGSLYCECTQPVCPARIDADKLRDITAMALAAFRLLACRGYARVDLREDGDGRLKVIEVNPNPDISPGSGTARQSEAAGMTYCRFIEKIALLGAGGCNGHGS